MPTDLVDVYNAYYEAEQVTVFDDDAGRLLTLSWYSLLARLAGGGLAEPRELFRGSRKIATDAWKALKGQKRLLLARSYRYPDLRAFLHAEQQLLLRSAGDVEAVFGEAVERCLVMALDVVQEGSPDELRTFIKPSEGGERPAMSAHQALLIVLAVLAVALVAYLLHRLRRASPEFELIAKHFAGQPWADRLLTCGALPIRWSLRDVWTIVALSGNEKRDAIVALTTLPEYQELHFERGRPFDGQRSFTTTGYRDGYVFTTVLPGLIGGALVIERALVDTGTADYVAMRSLEDHPCTKLYLERSELHYDHRLQAGRLQDVADHVREGELHEWLTQLAEAAPAQELGLIKAAPGDSYVEREMATRSVLNSKVGATVRERLHAGLKRARTNEVLLRAKVEAVDSSSNPYDD